MLDGIIEFWYLFPILLIIYSFAGGMTVRLLSKVATPLKDYNYLPTVSILLPVFNEGAHVVDTIGSIIECDWPANKLEIIAVDDCSTDDSYEHMQRAAKDWPQVKVFKNDTNSGKHVTLSKALKLATGEILICIDSDCIFDKPVIKELVACFADPEVGAVGGNIGITNVNTNVFTICQTLVYFMSFQVGKMLQSVTGKVFCISGCLFAVRRELFEEVEHEVKTRNWFGLSVRDGEDRYMTHAILMRGWKTIVNPNATCWTAAPDNLKQLFGQQIRWRRSGLRDLFWTWARMPEHFRIIGMKPLMAALIPESFTALWAALIIASCLRGGFAEMLLFTIHAVFLFSGFFLSMAVGYNVYCKKVAAGNILIKYPVLSVLSGAWFFMDSIVITILALFTFDVGVWGTREGTATPKSK